MKIEFSPKYEPLFDLLECWDVIASDDFKELDKEDQEYWTNLSKVDTVLISGGRDCFVGDQQVITYNGIRKIKDIKKGDIVLTYNERLGKKEWKPVFKTKEVIKKETIKINLKDGSTIECTPDHEFYNNGGWIKIKDLLSLWYGDLEENKKV